MNLKPDWLRGPNVEPEISLDGGRHILGLLFTCVVARVPCGQLEGLPVYLSRPDKAPGPVEVSA